MWADVPLASNKQLAECVRHTFVVRVGPEHLSIYHVHLFTASGGQRGGFTEFSMELCIESACLPAFSTAGGSPLQCYTLRGNNRTRIPDRVPRIGSSSFGRNYGRCKLALPCPCLTFFLPPDVQLYLAIWSARSRQLFAASLLSPSWRIVVLKASSAPQTSLPRLAMAVNVSPAAPSTPPNQLFCFCFC